MYIVNLWSIYFHHFLKFCSKLLQHAVPYVWVYKIVKYVIYFRKESIFLFHSVLTRQRSQYDASSVSPNLVFFPLQSSLDIPMDLPKTTKRLLLNDNKITSIPAFGLFNRLPNLLSVDLSRNKISNIEEGAFEGANSIIEMWVNLTSNECNKEVLFSMD